MKVDFLDAAGVDAALARLIEEHDEAHWAVAWGRSTTLIKRVMEGPIGIGRLTFGLAFAQTDPALVDLLVGRAGCRVVTSFPGGTYHPKVYAFRSGQRAAAIVGSSNFTYGGLGKNHEASVLIQGSVDDSALADIFLFTERSAMLGDAVTAELAERYRAAFRIAARLPKPVHDPLASVTKARLSAMTSPTADMTWSQFVRRIRQSKTHDVARSLRILGTAQSWFATTSSFSKLSTAQRKAVAGTLGEVEKAGDEELDQEWGWFGKMGAAGDFANRVAENDRSLARAVDSIPLRGPVERRHYDRFLGEFEGAFKNSTRGGAVATASRLLALKRPDVFLCVSGPNRAAAAGGLGFARTTLSLGNYWERVVDAIAASVWHGAEKPRGKDGQLWECRAAMLDVLFYAPASA